jgi:hypothetical protein
MRWTKEMASLAKRAARTKVIGDPMPLRIEVRAAHFRGTPNELVFAFTGRNTDFTEKFFVRVDVTEEFPFLVSKMGPANSLLHSTPSLRNSSLLLPASVYSKRQLSARILCEGLNERF